MGKRARRARRRREPLRLRLGAHGTGDHLGSIGAGWVVDGPMAELVALYQADTPEALQRVLVIPGRRTRTLCDDAVAAFRRAYTGDDTGLVESVVLACTGHRRKGVARPLLETLAGQGVLDLGHVSLLACVFLQTGRVCVTAPGAWLVDFDLQRRDGELCRLDPAKTYTLDRMIEPQLRRWAARETVSDREGVGVVLRALALDSRHGAAVILGLLDAADRLDEDDAAGVLDIGLDWPDPSVRLPALKRLVAAGRDGEALERAEGDRAAHIRRWAVTRRQRVLLTDRGQPAPAEAASAAPARRGPEVFQPSLFG